MVGSSPQQPREELKEEQPPPNKTSEPDIPSFRYDQDGACSHNVSRFHNVHE